MNVYNINKLKKHKNIYQVSTETGICLYLTYFNDHEAKH
jgi:hypothetical protein